MRVTNYLAVSSTLILCTGLITSQASNEPNSAGTESAPLFELPDTETDTVAESKNSPEINEDGTAAFTIPLAESDSEGSTSDVSDMADPTFADDGSEDEDYHILPDFVVSAEYDRGYYSANSLAGTRTNQLIKNTPMTISVVNKDLIEDLNLFGVEGLGNVVPSIEAEGEGFSERLLRFRGLLTRFQLYEFMPRQLSQDSYNVDRIDIVRGANSLVYGQAAPGGKANFLANRASFEENETTIDFLVGENDLVRSTLDTNYVINEKLAVRIMGVHKEQGFDQDSKEQEFDGATIALTYRPTEKTQFQFHLEGVKESRNTSPAIYTDRTGQFGYTGMLRDSPATADIVDLLDNGTLNYILNYNDGYGEDISGNRVPDFFTSKQDLKDFYTKQILIPNSGTVANTDPYVVSYTGPEHDGTSPSKGGTLSINQRDVDGFFTMADVTHSFTDDIQGKIAISHAEENTQALERGSPGTIFLTKTPNTNSNGPFAVSADGEGARAYADGLFISPVWQQVESSDDVTAFRGTLSWSKDLWGSEQQLLLGLDLDHRKSAEAQQMYLVKETRNDGTFNGGFFQKDFSQINSGNDHGVDFNTIGDNNVTGNITTDPGFPQSAGVAGLDWFDKRDRVAEVDGQAIWMALQGKYLDGRFNTLTGIRFDRINVTAETSDFQTGILNNKIDEDYTHTSPSLGALFWITDSVGIFANYAKSIESPNGWAQDPNGDTVPAETGTGVEAGFKFDMLDGKLNGQLIFFHIEKENERKNNFDKAILEVLYPFETNPKLYPDGENGDFSPIGRNVAGSTVVSEGIELDLYYNPTPSLSLFLGYAYVDTYFKESPKGILNDQTLPGTAHHSANLTLRYTFKDGPIKGTYLGVNEKYRSSGLLGTFYEDLNFDAQEDVLGLPDGTAPRTHDIWLDDHLETALFLGWRGKLSKGRDAPHWGFQVTVNNVFDTVDLISTGNARYTQGRTVTVKGSVKF
jgi:outer membrane receptor protein involved in Fe transport